MDSNQNPVVDGKHPRLIPFSGGSLEADYQLNETSLVDIWLVLIRRKRILMLMFAAGIALGGLVSWLMPSKYSYTASIEIGTMVGEPGVVLIEQPGAVLAKVEDGYIPLAMSQYARNHPETGKVFEISVRVPKKSHIIVLEAKGPRADMEIYTGLEQSVVEMLTSDHERITYLQRMDLNLKIEEHQREMESLRDDHKLLLAESKRLNDMANLLQKQIENTRSLIEDSESNRRRALEQLSDATSGMTLMMIDSEIEQHRSRLAKLEERLLIDLEDQRDMQSKSIADNVRAQAKQTSAINRIQAQLANLRETRPLVMPMQSLKPIGPGKIAIVTFFAAGGLVLGVLGALFREFLAKVPAEAATRAEE